MEKENFDRLNFPNHTKQGSHGFTLIEVLVTISIIIIVTGIVLVNYQGGQKQLILQRAVNKLSQDIRMVQEMAMSAQKYNGAVPSGGYGIAFTSSIDTYFIYADCDVGTSYGWKFTPSGTPCAGSTGELLEEVKLEESVSISAFSALVPFSINFVPPDPTVYFNATTTSSSEWIQLEISGQTKKVTVNSVGLITITKP